MTINDQLSWDNIVKHLGEIPDFQAPGRKALEDPERLFDKHQSFFEITYEPGHIIMPQGVCSDFAALLLEGLVDVYDAPRVKELIQNERAEAECWSPRWWTKHLELAQPRRHGRLDESNSTHQLTRLARTSDGKLLPAVHRFIGVTGALWNDPRRYTLVAQNDRRSYGPDKPAVDRPCTLLLIKRRALLLIAQYSALFRQQRMQFFLKHELAAQLVQNRIFANTLYPSDVRDWTDLVTALQHGTHPAVKRIRNSFDAEFRNWLGRLDPVSLTESQKHELLRNLNACLRNEGKPKREQARWRFGFRSKTKPGLYDEKAWNTTEVDKRWNALANAAERTRNVVIQSNRFLYEAALPGQLIRSTTTGPLSRDDYRKFVCTALSFAANLLYPDDIHDWHGLAAALANPDEAPHARSARRIREVLDAQPLEWGQAADADDPEARWRLLDALNALLGNDALYDPAVWASVPVDQKAHALAKVSERTPRQTMQLNRLLLEAAFPNQISHLRCLLYESAMPHSAEQSKEYGRLAQHDCERIASSLLASSLNEPASDGRIGPPEASGPGRVGGEQIRNILRLFAEGQGAVKQSLRRAPIRLMHFEPSNSEAPDSSSIIYQQGEPADGLYLIVSGKVRIIRSNPFTNEEILLNHLGQHGFCGLSCLEEGTQHSATAVAMSLVDIVYLERTLVQYLSKEYSFFGRKLSQERARLLKRDILPRRPPEEPTGHIASKLMAATNLLRIDMDLCVRCDKCVDACRDAHAGVARFHRANPELRSGKWEVARACVHCDDSPCQRACPVGAITVEFDDNTVHIHRSRCIGCTHCVDACPFGVIEMLPPLPIDNPIAKKHVATKCDLCLTSKHDPPCVVACPYGAAERGSPRDLFLGIKNWRESLTR
jgi:electron transport protein HydN